MHGIAVDDSTPSAPIVWFTERSQNTIGSLDVATGIYKRYIHPFQANTPWPHSVTVSSDHSVWFVDTCARDVGQLIPSTGVWNFWRYPTNVTRSCTQGSNQRIGPLFGLFSGTDFWVSDTTSDFIWRRSPPPTPTPSGACRARAPTSK